MGIKEQKKKVPIFLRDNEKKDKWEGGKKVRSDYGGLGCSKQKDNNKQQKTLPGIPPKFFPLSTCPSSRSSVPFCLVLGFFVRCSCPSDVPASGSVVRGQYRAFSALWPRFYNFFYGGLSRRFPAHSAVVHRAICTATHPVFLLQTLVLRQPCLFWKGR